MLRERKRKGWPPHPMMALAQALPQELAAKGGIKTSFFNDFISNRGSGNAFTVYPLDFIKHGRKFSPL
jgi:hypothetical protein